MISAELGLSELYWVSTQLLLFDFMLVTVIIV
jgi:hypothetical protein